MKFLGFGRNKKDKPLAEDQKEPVATDETQVSSAKSPAKRKPLAEARNDFAKSATKSAKTTTKVSKTDYSNILIKPRITEKATIIAEDGVYTFLVHPSATKKEVSKAIEQNFKVTPVKVNVINLKTKKVMRRGKRGKTSGGRKAMVYLKKGDSIEFV